MSKDKISFSLLSGTGLLVWLVLIVLPIIVLYAWPSGVGQFELPGEGMIALTLRSMGLAGAIAIVATLLGYIPGRLLGTARSRRGLLLFGLLIPLLLPRYVLYYAWGLLLDPTTALGASVAARPGWAKLIGTAVSCLVMIMWYWPLAVLIISQGWRRLDSQAWSSARLEATWGQRLLWVTLPLLWRSLLLAFGVCFALILSEFGTFHLAGIRTLGTQLAVVYELSGSEALVARAAWPVLIPAVLLSVILVKKSAAKKVNTPTEGVESTGNGWRWLIVALLMVLSWIMPLALLIWSVNGISPFRQFFAVQVDGLLWSLLIAMVSGFIAILIASSAVSVRKLPTLGGGLGMVMEGTIFWVLLLPGSLVAIALLRFVGILNLSNSLGQSWLMVSAGQAVRFAGIALIAVRFARDDLEPHLVEMTRVDGAGWFGAWRYVHFPRTWPLLVGIFLLVTMLAMTELPATMVLLPAGVPSFAQRLLNQMHYARDQQVIVSCLVLIGVYVLLAGLVMGLLRVFRVRSLGMFLVCFFALGMIGCGNAPGVGSVNIINVFGRGGQGPGEFIYPRAMAWDPNGGLYVVDKTGRIQRFDKQGRLLSVLGMPETEVGYPTGLSVAANGNLYVADTHYHRVLVFSRGGELISKFGRFGQEDGSFIYPTDVAFDGDGRIYVSEYGGNDRVSVFDEQGKFLFSFGQVGSGWGEFSRPAAVCVDQRRGRLYVADACNHRIAVYNLEGELKSYIGSVGTQAGQLRYPYDLALRVDGTLLVCEYGNNRVQLFSPEGRSLAVYGSPGRDLGQLAYPWGLAVDDHGRLYVVDAGNNRVQVWQL